MAGDKPELTPQAPAAPSSECPIIVWQFHDAPVALQDLSNNGGDEDWLAEIPPKFSGSWIGWMESGGPFGCCDVSEYDHPTKAGWKVKIGAHA